jgi:hypothetical protein
MKNKGRIDLNVNLVGLRRWQGLGLGAARKYLAHFLLRRQVHLASVLRFGGKFR